MDNLSRCGWESDFPTFKKTPALNIRKCLETFTGNPSIEQIRAWDKSIPPLQHEVGEILKIKDKTVDYSTIMEYELPMEFRRPDVILLTNGYVIVLELKGKKNPSQADLDQAAAYARDLRCYHRECENRPVIGVCMPMLAKGYIREEDGVHILGPDYLDSFVNMQMELKNSMPLSRNAFLDESAYRPLPTLVQAARELFRNKDLRTIKRASAATDPAVQEITRIIHEAAETKSRRLILLTGIPGAGKTLVGLRIAHAHFLDDLSVPRADGRPTAPAVFLSGNGPLVEVLQYELRGAGGGGRAFVRGVKEYVKAYSRQLDKIPPEHVLIFDEAQRAFDAEQVQAHHDPIAGLSEGKSEPEHFIEFSERIPQWCVVIGLIGSGQEIHIGEEAGIGQWCKAIKSSKTLGNWQVHCSPQVSKSFEDIPNQVKISEALNLNKEIRFHLTEKIHQYVDGLLGKGGSLEISEIAKHLERSGYHLRITNDFEKAKEYLKERYSEHKEAKYGIIASSKDKTLVDFGVKNDFQSTKQVRYGAWYSDDEEAPNGHSCRHLKTCVTEFGAQGLELDATLLAWGTDFIRKDGKWSNDKARGYMHRNRVRDPFQLRINSYRVLLTRGRDATIVFLPNIPDLKETWEYLVSCGFKVLKDTEVLQTSYEIQLLSYQEANEEMFKTALPIMAELAAGPLSDGMSSRSLRDTRELSWVRVPERYVAQNHYVVKICGHSMEPTLDDGDLVVFEYHRRPRKDGQVVVVAINEFGIGSGGEIGSAVKRLREEPERWVFCSDNKEYKKFSIMKDESNYPILGVAIYNLTQQKEI